MNSKTSRRNFLKGTFVALSTVTISTDIQSKNLIDELLRVLVVTGGHDYDPAFYTIFNGFEKIIWSHATSNKEAYKSDIREKYDVLVLYDFYKEIGEKEKKNLVPMIMNV